MKRRSRVWSVVEGVVGVVLFFWGMAFFFTVVAVIFGSSSPLSGIMGQILNPLGLEGSLVVLGLPAITPLLYVPKSTRKVVTPFIYAYFGGMILALFALIIQAAWEISGG